MARQIEKRENLRSKYQDDCKFRPDINLNSEVICATDPSRAAETDRFERLYHADVQRKAEKQDQVKREIYNECTFKPKINSISDKIAPSMTASERHLNYEG